MLMKFDASGSIEEPELHDGLLRAICLEESEGADSLVLECIDAYGQHFILRFPKLRRLRVDKFTEGQSVSEIEFVTGGAIPEDDLIWLYHVEAADWRSTWLPDDQKKSLTLLRFTTTYLCELRALLQSSIADWTYELKGGK